MTTVLILARAVLVAVFAVAAAAKLADRAGSRAALAGFGVPARAVGVLAVALPLAELAIAAALVPAVTAPAGALAAVALLAVFVLVIARALRAGVAPDCHCFGALHSSPAGRSTLVRNGALGVLAAGVAAAGLAGDSPALLPWVDDVSAVAAIGVALAVVTGAGAWLGFELLRQNGRLLARIDALEAALDPDATDRAPVAAPDVALRTLAGAPTSVGELREPGRPLLLVFSDPGCGPCRALLPEVAQWQRELPVALIGGGDPADLRAHAQEHGVGRVAVDAGDVAAEAYGVRGTPSAVLIAPDGTIAGGPSAGAVAIRALVAQAAGRPAPEASPSRVAPEPASRVGEPAPALDLPLTDGGRLRSADLRGAPALVVFWSPSCGFCARMLDDLRLLEAEGAARLVVVSDADAGLAGPTALDDAFATAGAFGSRGTPSAVLVDAEGRIASELAMGGPAVLALGRSVPVAA